MTHCTRHGHSGSSRAWRWVLARHRRDREACEYLADEIGDCASCWRDVALRLADISADLLAEASQPEVWAAYAIDAHLFAEACDRYYEGSA